MQANPTHDLVLDLPSNAEAPALARRAVKRLDLAQAQTPTVSLLVSELVTNAVLHASDSPAIRLEAKIRDRRLRLCVTDAGPGFSPRARPRPAADGGGYGLGLVEQLSSRWGVADTTVWFELPALAS